MRLKFFQPLLIFIAVTVQHRPQIDALPTAQQEPLPTESIVHPSEHSESSSGIVVGEERESHGSSGVRNHLINESRSMVAEKWRSERDYIAHDPTSNRQQPPAYASEYENLIDWLYQPPNDRVSEMVEYHQAQHQEMKAKACRRKYSDQTPQGYCAAQWDSFFCWPPTPPGQRVERSCYHVFTQIVEDGSNKELASTPIATQAMDAPTAMAYRICGPDGAWVHGNWTNYTECLDILPSKPSNSSVHLLVGYILFFCSILSLILLLLTVYIFIHFKSLICARLRVHRNLVSALILHTAMLAIISGPVVFDSWLPSYKSNNWLCKAILSLKMYAALASIKWMFIEGLLLHSRITTSVFRRDAPFRLYYCIGWGLPVVIILIWAGLMELTSPQTCWAGYGDSVFVWILTGPMITVLLINLCFLINIIRIMVAKLHSFAQTETYQIKKAMKATALLFPLLGITHLLFCFNPKDNDNLEEAYMLVNAILQSSQGIFVSVLYCFCNTDVQRALRNAYLRATARRRHHQSLQGSIGLNGQNVGGKRTSPSIYHLRTYCDHRPPGRAMHAYGYPARGSHHTIASEWNSIDTQVTMNGQSHFSFPPPLHGTGQGNGAAGTGDRNYSSLGRKSKSDLAPTGATNASKAANSNDVSKKPKKNRSNCVLIYRNGEIVSFKGTPYDNGCAGGKNKKDKSLSQSTADDRPATSNGSGFGASSKRFIFKFRRANSEQIANGYV